MPPANNSHIYTRRSLRRMAVFIGSIMVFRYLFQCWLILRGPLLSSTTTTTLLEKDRQKLEFLEKLIQLKMLTDELAAKQALVAALESGARDNNPADDDDRKNKTREQPQRLTFPSSSDAFCFGEDRHSRTCRFRNLCYEAKTRRFFLLRDQHSLLLNLPVAAAGLETELLDLTAVAEHNLFYWGVHLVAGTFFTRISDTLRVHRYHHHHMVVDTNMTHQTTANHDHLVMVTEPTLLTKRFYPLNVMHILHDDWLGFYSLAQIWPSISMDPHDEHDLPIATFLYETLHDPKDSGAGKQAMEPKRKINLVFFDPYPPNQTHDPPYTWFTGNFTKLEDIMAKIPDNTSNGSSGGSSSYACFSDVVVGNSKTNTWYQYGYRSPQGPIPGPHQQPSGRHLRDAAKFIFKQLGLPPHWDRAMQGRILQYAWECSKESISTSNTTTPHWIVESDFAIGVFSRRSNRLILNEAELEERLRSRFGLPVRFLRMEEHSLAQLVAFMQKTPMAIGMHGCLLTLAMFMPPGSILLEAFPYAVPAANYTPYRTMAGLPGMRLVYRAWENGDPSGSVGHPDRSRRLGGLGHLSPEERQQVLNSTTVPPHVCCENPYWLYRIFQDTRLNLDQIEELLGDALGEAVNMVAV